MLIPFLIPNPNHNGKRCRGFWYRNYILLMILIQNKIRIRKRFIEDNVLNDVKKHNIWK